ncbi:hypothetical protein [Pseudaestuariivita atlantica]|uniref:hypothetical protein n=1 Tax=Pseudaestuariivita atlantica TaxID=1317121 RepID=UPI0013F3EEB2|nr:hypothetical protein [Pseudaestuariivita atlantica]
MSKISHSHAEGASPAGAFAGLRNLLGRAPVASKAFEEAPDDIIDGLLGRMDAYLTQTS